MTIATTPDFMPTDLGFPAKFSQWRPGQYEAVMQALDAPQRFVAMNLPTGTGKSLSAMACSVLYGKRSVTLTSTKELQVQYSSDFDITDFRGRQNYDCLNRGNCADGRLSGCPHSVKSSTVGNPEDDSPGDCPYSIARREFLNSQTSVSNYACYFANVIHGEGMGDIDLLILDEAHNAIEELSSALAITLDHHTYETIRKSGIPEKPTGQKMDQWRNWARHCAPIVKIIFDTVKKQGGSPSWLRVIDTMKSVLTSIAMVPDDWILDESHAGQTTFAPLWPTDYAEKLLFRGAKKVFLLSATIVEKTTELLNINAADLLFISHITTFDPRRSPVYLFGASHIDSRSTPGQLQEMMGRMDCIIGRRLDRKGLTHPVSYEKVAGAEYISSNSEHRGLMISPRGRELHDSLKLFRESDAPRILNSPAIKTGYDFPMKQAEYQFIPKVPFIDARSPIMKARSEADPEYLPYLTAQTITQTCGRLMRSPEDRSETFILDTHANWFLKPKSKPGSSSRGGFRHLFPDWFLRQVQYPNSQPKPPEAL
jgi:Rad3-related DNA helicase